MSDWKLKILKQKHQNNERISFLYDKDGQIKSVEDVKIIDFENDKIVNIRFSNGNDTLYPYAISKITFIDEFGLSNNTFTNKMITDDATMYESSDVAKYYQQLIYTLSENELIEEGIEANYNKVKKTLGNFQMCSPLLKKYLNNQKTMQNEVLQSKELILPFISNISQKKAIQIALDNEVSIIQGPPGTGKTQTILNLIATSICNDYRVLVVSKNNSAIDNVAEKLDKHKTLHHAFIRVGNRQTNIDLLSNLESKLNCDFAQHMEIDADCKPTDLVKLEHDIQILEHQLEEMTKKRNVLNELKTQQRHIQKKLSLYQFPFRDNDTREIFKKFTNPQIIRYISNVWRNQEQRVNVLKRKISERIIFKDFKEDEYTRYIWRFESLYAEKEIKRIESELQDYDRIYNKIQEQYTIYKDESIIRTNKKIEEQFKLKMSAMNEYKKVLSKARQESPQGIGESKEFTALRANATKLYPIVLSTADSCVNLPLTDKFDVVIMDEASQADLITFLPVMNILKKEDSHLVIVGDDRQLKNVVSEKFVHTEQEVYQKIRVPEAFRYSSQTVLSSVKTVFQPIQTLLREHYRCDYNIINYCNKKYYEDQLIIYSKEVSSTSMKVMKLNQERNSEAGNDNKSRKNKLEVRAIKNYVKDQFNQNAISVITPFASQKEELKSQLIDLKENIGTIHQFQGRENEKVLFSTVLTYEKGMLSQEKTLLNDALINVAVSRAQNEFVLFTHDAFFKENKHHLFDLIRYTETYGEELDANVHSIFAHLYKQYKYVNLRGKHDSLWEKHVFDYVLKSVDESLYSGFYVAAKVPLADISADKTFLEQNQELKKFALHPNTHLDICIVHGLTNQVIFVIEVDGGYHNTTEQIERDRKKNQILDHHDIPILRIRSKDVVEEKGIKKEVEKILKENQWRQSIFDKMDNGVEEEINN